jgi:hypothetical protein
MQVEVCYGTYALLIVTFAAQLFATNKVGHHAQHHKNANQNEHAADKSRHEALPPFIGYSLSMNAMSMPNP